MNPHVYLTAQKTPQEGSIINGTSSLPIHSSTHLLLYWNCSLMTSMFPSPLDTSSDRVHIFSWLLFPSRNLLLLVSKLLLSPGFLSTQLAIPHSLCWFILLYPTSKRDFPGLNPKACFCLHLSLSALVSSALSSWLIAPGSMDLNIIFILMTTKFVPLVTDLPPWVPEPYSVAYLTTLL